MNSALSIEREFLDAPIGDRRLQKRLCAIATAVASAPDRSFPVSARSAAALRATYRFVNSETVTPDAVLRPHVLQTAARAAEVGCALVVHDTTQFEFPGEAEREGLGFVRSRDDQGFSLHCALAVAADGSRRPLGVVAQHTWTRTEKKPKRQRGGETFKDPKRESKRWGNLVDEVEDRLGSLPVVHVMDCEADAFPLLQSLVQNERRFVIRMRQDRVVLDEDDERAGYASEPIATAPWKVRFAVPLSRRSARRMPGATHDQRSERSATLSVSSTRIRLKAPVYIAAADRDPVDINVVHVIEMDPPEDDEPVSWVLLTTEPNSTADDVLRVIEMYRTRWLIEEFFKALKSGCAVEKRQLESYDALANALAIFIPIAWQLLLLRSLHRTRADDPAELVLTPTQIDVLRARLPKLMPASATVDHALRAIAYLGGHFIKKLPGWQVLGRGFDELLKLEEGWRLAQNYAERSGQS